MAYKKAEFGNAAWIAPSEECISPMIYSSLPSANGETVKITIGSLGMFELFINGRKVGNDLFLPLNTDFHERDKLIFNDIPFKESLGHRLYCPVYDISEYLDCETNTVCFVMGGGWYEMQGCDYDYGKVQICWKAEYISKNKITRTVCSDGGETWKPGYITEYSITLGETHDYGSYENAAAKLVEIRNAPETSLYIQDCPPDKVIRRIVPKKISKNIYDVGEIISGYPILKGMSPQITVRYGELLNEDGTLCEENVYDQHTTYINGENRMLYPRFTWLCFRYFEVIGEAEVTECDVIHSDVAVTSEFECGVEVLNWLAKAYVRTQLDNMHCGIPSDCPHTERRGYTGDGQLTCGAALMQLDALKFYKKWIYDIADCQDRKTGHIQYTAPFTPSGGGPGGWGCAVVNVPYEYYKACGDTEVLRDMYPHMIKWLEFMENHSENELVTSDIKNAWCLGDWCAPAQDSLNKFGGMIIPEPFVNTYFYIKSMLQIIEIGNILNIHENDDMLSERIEKKKSALISNYFDESTGNFANDEQGSNAYAVDLGIGDERTLKNTVEKYNRNGYYDTGIFGTDILTRILFENGYASTAVSLLTSEKDISFYSQMKGGATTLKEYWNGVRSQCHPMFGAVTRYLYEYILGIRQAANSVAYENIIIEPVCRDIIKSAKGSITTVKGKISVEYTESCIKIEIPYGVNAVLRSGVKEIRLNTGITTIVY